MTRSRLKDKVITGLILAVGFVLAVTCANAQNMPECPEGYICTWSGTGGSVDTSGEMTTTVISPPPTAVSPQFSAGNGNDLCTVGIAGAVQTQILGLSAGKTVRDMNCERLKNSKTLYDMGMKVAAVSTMCQDERVFQAMMDAGTPCPYDGMIGEDAKAAWAADPERYEGKPKGRFNEREKMGLGAVLGVLGLLIAF
ncbi:hypothetical protein UFOVP373_40 [uncultured Caudovirales phage]|uniref:Uncharacterized protein n=1 Tax=uncultured Caudovirales phage TaxID=2100421 RepID=A0A6J7WY38_9CAUD|nr:hypothetical protein UFOVP373_40 [uncultured Caudovirales phage]